MDYTFGELKGVASRVILPSTLKYKERVALRSEFPHEYGRLYEHGSVKSRSVYDRLSADAVVRQSMLKSDDCRKDDLGKFREGPSGFATNNCKDSVRLTSSEVAAAKDQPAQDLNNITALNSHKRHSVDFMCATRPQAQTTNQTMRMLGTYKSDAQVIKKLGTTLAGVIKSGYTPDIRQ